MDRRLRHSRRHLTTLLAWTISIAGAICLSSSASEAYDVTPNSSQNQLRLLLDDRIGLSGNGNFAAYVEDAPAWIVCDEPHVELGRVAQVVVPFRVLDAPLGSRGQVSIRVRGYSAGGTPVFDRVHEVELAAAPETARVQRAFTLDECCLAAASIDDFPEVGTAPQLVGSHPNPVRGLANIVFGLPADGTAELRIFDVRGRRVREFLTPRLNRGYHRITWDTTDESGREVVSGVYFYQLSVGEWTDTKKLEILR